MKDEYDFSSGERGKFYRPDTKLNLPVYLDEEVFGFIKEIADRQESDISVVVNKMIRSDMALAEAMQ